MKWHRRQVKRLRTLHGARVQVQRVSCRTRGLYCVPPRWRVYLMPTHVERYVIGDGDTRRGALRDAFTTPVDPGKCRR